MQIFLKCGHHACMNGRIGENLYGEISSFAKGKPRRGDFANRGLNSYINLLFCQQRFRLYQKF